MAPKLKHAGIAGILSGIFLIGEFSFFMASGFNPEVFQDPSRAAQFLAESQTFIRIAVLFGITNALIRILFIVGLASELQKSTQTGATGVLYFGVLGSIGHGLVALSFYIGLPFLENLAVQNHEIFMNTWGAFVAITLGFQGLGGILSGVFFLISGWGIVKYRIFSKAIGWVGIATGFISVLTVIASETPISFIAQMLFMPMLILAIIFYISCGNALRTLNNEMV